MSARIGLEDNFMGKTDNSEKRMGGGLAAKSKRKAIQQVKQEAARAVSRIRRGSAATARRVAAQAEQHLQQFPYNREDPAALDFLVGSGSSHVDGRYGTEFENLGDLPENYGTGRMGLVARDPHWFYCYWDIPHKQFCDASTTASDGKVYLQVYYPGGELVKQIELPEGARSWMIPMKTPGATYYAEIGTYASDGAFQPLSRSQEARAPRDTLSDNGFARLVTIPFHLSFWQLVELVTGHQIQGETLAQALARLQELGFEFPFDIGEDIGSDSEKQRLLLSYLSGEIERRISMGSLEIVEVLRKRLTEQLSSQLGSQFASLSSGALSSLGLSSGSVAGSMSSGAVTGGMSSETLSSSRLSEQMSSGAVAGQLSSAQLSSGALAGQLSSAQLSSGALAGQLSSAQLSSGALLGQLSSAQLSSFGLSSAQVASQLGQSSSSYGFSSAELLNQLSSAALSSGALTSPMGSSFGARESERGFFMHVNAELIIYGGTDPKATVTVEGKQIALREDGTFSYHFTFPDGRFHVPIEATSPDGVETRGALLSFLRMSDYSGDVQATGQPAHLSPPIGRQA
jgi:hypothetical protein